MLEIKNINFSYSGKKILNAISFKVNRGEIVSILGENGSGKTTLLKLIAGLEQLKEGEIFFNNKKVAGPEDKLIAGHPEIKMIFQDFRLEKNITVEENIRKLLPPLKEDEKNRRTNRLLMLCKLKVQAQQKVEELSGGEKQRLSIARALVENPAVILMDEPFSNLDGLVKVEFKQILFHALKSLNISAVFVTHDPIDALKFSDQVLVFKNGKLIRKGSPEQVYLNPRSLYTAKLTGEINIVNPGIFINLPNDRKSLIRPEQIELSDVLTGRTLGTILSSTFCGSFYELRLIVGKNQKLIVHSAVKFDTGKEVGIFIKNKS